MKRKTRTSPRGTYVTRPAINTLTVRRKGDGDGGGEGDRTRMSGARNLACRASVFRNRFAFRASGYLAGSKRSLTNAYIPYTPVQNPLRICRSETVRSRDENILRGNSSTVTSRHYRRCTGDWPDRHTPIEHLFRPRALVHRRQTAAAFPKYRPGRTIFGVFEFRARLERTNNVNQASGSAVSSSTTDT